MKPNIKAIIFDMGGVILRTQDRKPREKLGRKFNKSYNEMDHLIYGTDSAKKATRGEIAEEEHREMVLKQFGLSMEDQDWFFGEFWGGDVKDQELVDYIFELKKNYITALLSNAWSRAREDIEPRYQFLDAFDFSVFSAEIKMAKPDPQIYEWVLEQIKVKPEEAVFVDDFVENIRAANQLGIHGILFESTEQVKSDIQKLIS